MGTLSYGVGKMCVLGKEFWQNFAMVKSAQRSVWRWAFLHLLLVNQPVHRRYLVGRVKRLHWLLFFAVLTRGSIKLLN